MPRINSTLLPLTALLLLITASILIIAMDTSQAAAASSIQGDTSFLIEEPDEEPEVNLIIEIVVGLLLIASLDRKSVV